MRLLRVLGLVLVHARAVGHISRAKAAANFVARRHHRLRCHVDAVGPHIGDVTRLIQALRRRHAGLGPHAELARRLLLQGRGHEGRIGVARRRLAFDCRNRKCSIIDSMDRQFGSLSRRNVEFVQLLAAEQHQPRRKILPPRRGQNRADRPELARPERLDLHLAFDDQPQADRLHPPRRLGPRQLAPQDRRQGEAHQIVQCAPRQIGLDQRHIDLTRMRHRLGDGRPGDGVEGHPADLLALFQRPRQRLLQMPGNRLALAVGVGRQDQFVIGFQGLGDRLDMLATVRRHLPGHRKAIVRVDRAILGRQIADMAIRRQNRIARSKIFVDCLGLGW